MATDSTPGFWAGLGDNVGSILEKAGGFVDTVKTITGNGNTPANVTSTTTPPASGITAAKGFFASLSTGAKIAIGVGAAIVAYGVYKLFSKGRK